MYSQKMRCLLDEYATFQDEYGYSDLNSSSRDDQNITRLDTTNIYFSDGYGSKLFEYESTPFIDYAAFLGI